MPSLSATTWRMRWRANNLKDGRIFRESLPAKFELLRRSGERDTLAQESPVLQPHDGIVRGQLRGLLKICARLFPVASAMPCLGNVERDPQRTGAARQGRPKGDGGFVPLPHIANEMRNAIVSRQVRPLALPCRLAALPRAPHVRRFQPGAAQLTRRPCKSPLKRHVARLSGSWQASAIPRESRAGAAIPGSFCA